MEQHPISKIADNLERICSALDRIADSLEVMSDGQVRKYKKQEE